MPQKTAFNRELWRNPPNEYSQVPFWFWNDALDEDEMIRQLDDFQAHGVDAFVIHPRLGLPASIAWNSSELFDYMRFGLAEARRRGMWVLLYDEGMYPSGSSAGQVVASDPSFQVRGLICEEKECSGPNKNLVAKVPGSSGKLYHIYDQPVDGVIRGLHFLGKDPEAGRAEEEDPATDLLNPAAVRRYLELVYDRFYSELGEYFGTTVPAIFTDEPHPLGRIRTPDVFPGTTGILEHVNAFLGYDFTPHLPSLWHEDEPDAQKYRRDYREAISARMSITYFKQLSDWCEEHGVALTGHPADPDDFGHLDHLHIPGQDIVWRHIEPFQASALEGPPSTMAKAAASSALHHGRKRNLNEFAGCYGHELTFFEYRWLASWLLIRGCNMLSPHAFYYSVRGPRRDDRPPDLGPNSPWWAEYRPWALATKRLCWLNAEFRPVCRVAILGRKAELPWKAAKVCFENQIDFHYIYAGDLSEAEVKEQRLVFRGETYVALICELEDVTLLPEGIPIFTGLSEKQLCSLRELVPPAVTFDTAVPGLRFRHLSDGNGTSLILLFNEGAESISTKVDFKLPGSLSRLDEAEGSEAGLNPGALLTLQPGEWAIFLQE